VGQFAPPEILLRAREMRYLGGMPNRSSKRPRGLNSLAKFIVDSAVGEPLKGDLLSDGRDPAAVALGRKGGLKGGKARAESLSAKKRSEIAKKAAAARWKKDH
jgi:hypothetical protein